MNIAAFSTETLQAVQDLVHEKIGTASSQNEAARQLDISPAHLINFRDGKWDKISEKVFNLVATQVGVKTWKDANTVNFSLAVNLLTNAQQYSRFLALIGATGTGKTHALKLYARKNSNAYYMMCDSEMNKKRFMQAILQAVGVRPDDAGSNTGDYIDAICRKLNGEVTPLLILDDAGKISDALLRVIQIIYDRTEGRAGIVIAGVEYLQTMLEKKARRNIMGFRELRRRVAYWEEMSELSREDFENVCQANGVSDTGAIKYLQQNCIDLGTLRNMIENLKKYAEKRGEAMSRDLLAQMNQNRTWVSKEWK